MKKVLFASATTLALSATAIAAAEWNPWAVSEYTLEAQVFSVETGVDLAINDFTITPTITFDNAVNDFDFAAAEVSAAYSFNTSVTTYATIEADSDFNYSETTFGVRVDF